MTKTEIIELIDYCKNHSQIDSKFPWGIYPYVARKDVDMMTLYIYEIAEDTKQVQEDSFMEFRVIAWDNNTSPLDIKDALKFLKTHFTQNNIQIWNTTYFQIDWLNDSRIWMNQNRRYEWMQSFIFKKA